MTRSVVEAIHQADHAHYAQIAAESMRGRTLRNHAVALAVAGRTTLDEAMRISVQSEQGAPQHARVNSTSADVVEHRPVASGMAG